MHLGPQGWAQAYEMYKVKTLRRKESRLGTKYEKDKERRVRSHPLHIKYKTTTPPTTLMRKWPWIVVTQLILQGKTY